MIARLAILALAGVIPATQGMAQSCAAADRAALIVGLAPGHTVERTGADRCLLRGLIAEVVAGDVARGAGVRVEFLCAVDRPAAPGGPVYHAPDGIAAADRIELHVTADGRIAYGGHGLIARFDGSPTGPVPDRPDCA